MKVDGLEIVEPGLRYQFRDGHLEVTAGMDPAFENGYVLLSQALGLQAERDTALARVKELEGELSELCNWKWGVAVYVLVSAHGYRTGGASVEDWLESRLKRLVELEVLVADLKRWNAGKDAQLHETEEERAALAIKVAGLENVVAYWKDRHLAAAGVHDRLAERLLPIAQQFGYQGNEGELGDWLERAIRARAELAEDLAILRAEDDEWRANGRKFMKSLGLA